MLIIYILIRVLFFTNVRYFFFFFIIESWIT